MKSTVMRLDVLFRRKLRQWLRQNPRALRILRRYRCFSTDREALGRGLAVGLFFGLTPTVGFQTALVLPSCLLFRGNFPVAFAATWVSNPVTMGPLYVAFNWLGEHLVGSSILSEQTSEAFPWLSLFAGEGAQTVVGCLPFAIPAALMGYVFIRLFVRQPQDSECAH